MAKQTFTTGQVLTAAQMTSLQQTAMGGGAATAKTASYVLVAADAGTTVAMNAAGATTITVNTGLFAAGDTVFIQNLGAGACTVTAGTATVATAGSLILPQNDAGILYFTATGASIFYDFIQAGAASPLTTKGDVYTFSTSDARLPVGTNGQVLTADSTEATGLKFATPAAGGMTSIASGSLSGGSLSLTSISGSYNHLQLVLRDYEFAGTTTFQYKINNDTTANIYVQNQNQQKSTTITNAGYTGTPVDISNAYDAVSGSQINALVIDFFDYANTTCGKLVNHYSAFMGSSSQIATVKGLTFYQSASAITQIDVIARDTTFSAGTYILYGIK